jgi:hypothetical protein
VKKERDDHQRRQDNEKPVLNVAMAEIGLQRPAIDAVTLKAGGWRENAP